MLPRAERDRRLATRDRALDHRRRDHGAVQEDGELVARDATGEIAELPRPGGREVHEQARQVDARIGDGGCLRDRGYVELGGGEQQIRSPPIGRDLLERELSITGQGEVWICGRSVADVLCEHTGALAVR